MTTDSLPETCPHFSAGNLPVAFVYSVPGKLEFDNKRPVSGATGANLDMALVHIHAALPHNFESLNRYDYRITNSFNYPIAMSLGHNRSEPTKAQVMEASNVARVLRELEGCKIVVLCGKKAQLLLDIINKTDCNIICVCHTSDRGLSITYKVPAGDNQDLRSARRKELVKRWADELVIKFRENNF